MYWLFVAFVFAALFVLTLAVEIGDRQLAATVVGLALCAFIVIFFVWVIRLLRAR